MNNSKAILKAISEQNLQEIKKLNPKPSMPSGMQDQKLIHIAAQQGNSEIFSFLLEKCDNIEITDSIGRTALHYAVSYGQLQNVILLIQKGANVNAQTLGGDTPLIKSIQNKKLDCYQYLLQTGADAQKQNIIGQNAEQILQYK